MNQWTENAQYFTIFVIQDKSSKFVVKADLEYIYQYILKKQFHHCHDIMLLLALKFMKSLLISYIMSDIYTQFL